MCHHLENFVNMSQIWPFMHQFVKLAFVLLKVSKGFPKELISGCLVFLARITVWGKARARGK